jgi:MFS family permease
MIKGDRLHFFLINIGHFLDHLFTLIFATVAAVALSREWGLSYAELLNYATPGFFAFGLFALPAGWLADKWSRDGMMAVFFIGSGLGSIATGFAQTPLQIAIGLFATGVFAAIYHPVGLAILTQKWRNTGMRLAMNGVWGNLGVASAALLTGYFIDNGGWRAAFIVPGVVSIGFGVIYLIVRWPEVIAVEHRLRPQTVTAEAPLSPDYKALLLRVSAIVFLTTAVSSVIFQSTTFALPKIFAERLQDLAVNLSDFITGIPLLSSLIGRTEIATAIGAFAFAVFAIASLAQLIVGASLDRFGPRPVFLTLAAMQILFFSLMPGLTDAAAFAVALGFMLGAFGQIPINDYMIGKMARGEFRARIYGTRFVVSFTVLASTLPLVGIVYDNWGFDTMFRGLAALAAVILLAVACLPGRLPSAEATPAPAPLPSR